MRHYGPLLDAGKDELGIGRERILKHALHCKYDCDNRQRHQQQHHHHFISGGLNLDLSRMKWHCNGGKKQQHINRYCAYTSLSATRSETSRNGDAKQRQREKEAEL